MARKQSRPGTKIHAIALVSLGLSGCSGASATNNSAVAGGTTGTGGAAPSGGAVATGGNVASNTTGGAAVAVTTHVGGNAGTTGGVASSGGSSNAGGTSTTGGSKTDGGTTSAGGAQSSGGTSSSGGATSAGGNSALGGNGAKTGGTSSSGGASSNSGGSKPTGGTRATGGALATGGNQAAGGTASSGGSSASGGTHAGAWQVMPLGDSITGTTCYPQLLSQEFKSNNHTNFTFVGNQLNNQSCNGAPTVQSEGHGGYLVTYLETDSPPATGKGTLSELKTWAAEKPDIVFMHYGTNDVWNSITTTSILTGYTNVLSQFRSQNPNVVFFVALIIPLNPSGCSNCESNVEALNAAIPAWASAQSTSVSPIYVVDVHSALTAATYVPNSTYTTDGVHPNAAGAQLMADKMYAAIVAHNYF